ncbi:hypothetical protein ACFLYK_02560 [Candidatus Cloacimonadota bacterium]
MKKLKKELKISFLFPDFKKQLYRLSGVMCQSFSEPAAQKDRF